MATKTTSVVFKQHDPQSVADLSDVAGALPWKKWRLQTRKMIDFWGSSVQKGSPSTIWGGRNLLLIFDFENMAKNEHLHFLNFFLIIFFHQKIEHGQKTTDPF